MIGPSGGGLVRDLPAYGALGKGDRVAGLTGSGAGHGGEGSLYVVALGPDGNFFHGVAVGDGGLFKAVGDGYGGEAIDAGDFAVAVAEARGVAGSGGSDSVAADVDAGFDGLLEEEIFDQGVELLGLLGVAGFEGEARIGQEALGVVEVVVIDADSEVGGGGGSFAGVIAANHGEGSNGKGN